MASPAAKRAFDLLLGGLLLVLLLPLLALLAVLVRLLIGSPVLFRQRRPGLGEQPFTLYKFRTMTGARDASGALLPDEQRLTRFGALLRKSSLDELPELLNVVRGDMSLVGPRPLLVEYLPFYTVQERRRHEVRPGLTGWAQVNGRNRIPWQERLALDIWYVDNRTILLDVRILLRTVGAVLTGAGVAVNPDSAETRLDDERRKLQPG